MPPIEKPIKAAITIIGDALKSAPAESAVGRAVTGAERMSEEIFAMSSSQFKQIMPQAFRSMYPEVTAAEQPELLRAAQSMTSDLQIRDVKLPQFFSDFDAKAFMDNRRSLAMMGINDASQIASGTKIYGRNIGRFLYEMGQKGVSPTDAMKALPSPSTADTSGLAHYIQQSVGSIDKGSQLLDRLPLIKDIGDRWSTLTPELKQLPVDDLAFRIRTGISKEEYLGASTKPLGFSFNKMGASPEPFFRGEARATVNNSSAGILWMNTEGAQIEITQLSVNPAFRRLGIGEGLVRYVERNAPANIESLGLDVSIKNMSARSLYSRLGFEVESARSSPYTLGLKKIIRRGE